MKSSPAADSRRRGFLKAVGYSLVTRALSAEPVRASEAESAWDRVRRRGAEFERPISESYLALVADSYNRFFYHYTGAPVLIVNSERLNFVDRPADFGLLLERVQAMRGQREFFNLGE